MDREYTSRIELMERTQKELLQQLAQSQQNFRDQREETRKQMNQLMEKIMNLRIRMGHIEELIGLENQEVRIVDNPSYQSRITLPSDHAPQRGCP